MLTYSDCIVGPYTFSLFFFVSFLATVFDGEIKLYKVSHVILIVADANNHDNDY